jgi:cell wall-associated NlpC family hydrolase
MTNKKNNLSNLVQIAFIVGVVIFVGYLGYNKLGVFSAKEELVTPNVATSVKDNTLKDSIVTFGMRYLGTPYAVAGNGKNGFDCSGFVYYVYQHFNIDVPRSSIDFEHFGKEVSIENVQKGDILLFLSPTRNVIGHIGIVSNPLGRNSDFVHASSGREMKVIITNFANSGYPERFIKAIRVL